MGRKALSDEQKALAKERERQRQRENKRKLALDPVYRSQRAESKREYRKRKRMEQSDCKENEPPTSANVDMSDRSKKSKRTKYMQEYRTREILEPLKNEMERFTRGFDLNLSTYNPKWIKIANKFFEAVSDGPVHRCYCCDRLWFKRSIKTISKSNLRSRGCSDEFINYVFHVDTGDEGQFCLTCHDTIYSKSKIPTLAAKNGFQFPEIPDCLKDLTPLEERLVSPRLPFMQIREVGRTQQYKISGSVVNVPIDIDTTVNQLPRNLDEKYTVHVKLKKRLTFKSHYMYELINPNRVFEAVQYLKQQELYQQLNVEIDLNWFEKFKNRHFDVDSVFKECEGEDEVEEEEECDLNPGALHTLIGGGQGICLAPGENQTPKSLLYDNFAEELSFPTIYCGKVRYFEKEPTYTQIANSEIRRYDRRAARPDHLFYAYSKFINTRLINAIGTAIRKKKSINDKLTAEDVLDEDYLNELITHNDGYKFLKDLKHSPAHWEHEKKRVFAAIRQWGKPTLFITVSAAETHWIHLQRNLSIAVDKKDLTLEEVESLDYQTKCRLIQRDPITCALYFDHKFRELMKTWKSDYGPFGKHKIIHSYYRIEFQHRGSPHAHMLVWLDNVPDYYENGDNDDCIKFVNEMITCSSENPNISYQYHKHSFTCLRKDKHGEEHCRFHIPYFPMDKTRLLEPFTEEDSERKCPKEVYNELVHYLSTIDYTKNGNMSFDDFLKSINMSLGDYINTIKSGIKRPTLCLKRDVKEIMINNYNPKILNLMQSNMDIQYIVNGYACAAYMNDYINKSQRGMSKLLKECVEKCREGSLNLRDSMKCVTNAFVGASDTSAQEAAWSLLELAMSRLSENDIFIPTFPPAQRAKILKSKEQLQRLSKDSKEIFEHSIFDKYGLRPLELEDLCLADFATGYEFKKVGNQNMALMGCSLYAQKRRSAKILRCAGYQLETDKYQYFREQITLYTNWRDEKVEILDQEMESLFRAKRLMIEENRQKYNCLDIDNMKQLMEDLQECEEENNENETETIHNEDIEDCFEELDYDENEMKFDIGRDMDEYVGKEFDIFKIQQRLPDDQYRQMIRKANMKQQDLIKHVMNLVERKPSNPFQIFVTGPAGCGKSFLINGIVESLGRMYDQRGSDPSSVKILKTAPTGKAAYNILGLTLHGAFGLPTKIPKCVPGLSASTLNEYRSRYKDLKLLIIDEISMVGYSVFQCVDQRLRQIMGIDEPFGGVSVIVLGDFRQLPPVGDTPVYKISKQYALDEIAGNVLWNLYQFYELDEIMRQKDDLKFATCLNNLASGEMTDEDVSLLKSREVSNIDSIPMDAIHLFHSNKEVDSFNAQKILKLSTEGCIAEAIDTVVGIGSKNSKQYALRTVRKKNRSETANLSTELHLKISAKYMVVHNIQTRDGLVNGATGILRHIEYCPFKRKGGNKMGVKRIWLEFEDETIGKTTRQECMTYMVKNGINLRYTPIIRVKKIIEVGKRSSQLGVCRSQFPIMVAEAMTIHKSQGATYKNVAINIFPQMKRSLLYVAASRATKAEGLYIVGDFQKPAPPSADDRVMTELQRLKTTCQLIPTYAFLREREEEFNGIQFMYHNVQSLPAHYEDILADPYFGKCNDLILLAETWTLRSDDFKVPGFEEVVRIDSDNKKRKPSGVIAYVNEKFSKNIVDSRTINRGNVQMLLIYILNNIRFALLYASPQATVDEKLDVIFRGLEGDEECKTVLVGDFNTNFNSSDGSQIIKDLTVMDLDIRTNPAHFTTRGHTTIDAIFSNKSMRTGVYMSTYSYHFPLYGRID